jgi:hypothetical protein
MLSLIHMTTIRMRPIVKAKLTKLCAYLAASEKLLNASGPMTGTSRILPNVMLSPVSPRTTNETAVSQCEKRSNALKRRTFWPERPAEIRVRPMMR